MFPDRDLDGKRWPSLARLNFVFGGIFSCIVCSRAMDEELRWSRIQAIDQPPSARLRETARQPPKYRCGPGWGGGDTQIIDILTSSSAPHRSIPVQKW